MATVVIVGGGVGGLSAALLLARDRHQVTVLERDDAQPPRPEQAWASWERRSVNQFRLPHYFLARFREVLDAELPDVAEALAAAGALRVNTIDGVPAEISGGRRPDDDRFTHITGRRPVVEAALATVVAAEPGLSIRRGVTVRGLLAEGSGNGSPPHVTGVVTDDGQELRADLVVDAAGRRSALPAWLEAIGARRPHEELADSGFVYYGRHFRSPDGSVPFMFGAPAQPYDSVSLLTLPADNGHWSVTIVASAKDATMRAVRDVDVWSRVIAAYPLAAHWTLGEPITDVDVMAKIEDRVRELVVDGQPVVTGVVLLADSWACTNPSIGRGASIAILHAVELRDTLRQVGVGDRGSFARAFHDATKETVAPLVDETLALDRHRRAEIAAQIAGHPYDTDDRAWLINKAVRASAGAHPDLLRGALDIGHMLATVDDVAARPEVQDALRDAPPPVPPPGPTRAELLGLVGAPAPTA